MWTYNQTNELYHYGVPGMKWGVRKAQKAVNKYSNKAQRQADESFNNANYIKKILDDNYYPEFERAPTKSQKKHLLKEMESSIRVGKTYLSAKKDIMSMDVNKINKKDVKERFKKWVDEAGVYYPFA